MYVGIDWAADEHAVCIIEADGRVVDRFSIAHSAVGFDRLIGRLARRAEPGALPVALERPDGRLVTVSSRPGTRSCGSRRRPSRPGARLRSARVPRAIPVTPRSSPTTWPARARAAPAATVQRADAALRAVVRSRSDLVESRVAAANQLRAALAAGWPGAGELFADVASEIALAFLERYPTATSAARLGEGRMGAFLRKHATAVGAARPSCSSGCGPPPPAWPMGRSRGPPRRGPGHGPGPARPGPLDQGPRPLGRGPSGRASGRLVFGSLPRAGRINAAQMLAEWGDCREAYDGPEAVAALSGMAPVTRRSGKYLAVGFRWACNTRFRKAMATFADNSRHASPWAASVYGAAIDRGADHPHAVRILARAWIRVIHRCWLDGVAYDPARHGAARRLRPRGWPDRGLGLTQRVSWSDGSGRTCQLRSRWGSVGIHDCIAASKASSSRRVRSHRSGDITAGGRIASRGEERERSHAPGPVHGHHGPHRRGTDPPSPSALALAQDAPVTQPDGRTGRGLEHQCRSRRWQARGRLHQQVPWCAGQQARGHEQAGPLAQQHRQAPLGRHQEQARRLRRWRGRRRRVRGHAGDDFDDRTLEASASSGYVLYCPAGNATGGGFINVAASTRVLGSSPYGDHYYLDPENTIATPTPSTSTSPA